MFHRDLTLPDGDVLIHAGDHCFGPRGHMVWGHITDFGEWLGDQTQFKLRIMIAGNHDTAFEKLRMLARSCLPSNVTYLEEQGVSLDNVFFWGSPWTPSFMGWAFNMDRGDPIARHWELIPGDVNVLITHGPPITVLDGPQNVGCEELFARVLNLGRLKAHIFGHVHEGYGTMPFFQGTTFVNASVVNEEYELVNQPVVLDINP
jgi:predicted phosphohydrolase